MLPCHPLLSQRQLWILREGEFVLRIEVSCQVAQNSCTLHDTKIALVVVDQDWDASIWTFVCEPLLFLDVLPDVDALVYIVWLAIRLFQLFKNDARLVAYAMSVPMPHHSMRR